MGLPLGNRGDAKTRKENGTRFYIFALIKRVRLWVRYVQTPKTDRLKILTAAVLAIALRVSASLR
jgi:hypothetical protein